MHAQQVTSDRIGLTRRGLLLAGLSGITAAVPSTNALAAAKWLWPGDGLKILLAYPPGGVSDLVARALARQLSEQLKVPVLVESRPGAGGSLALDLLARTAPDGQTLAFTAAAAVRLLHEAAKRREPQHAAPHLPATPVAGVMRTPVLLIGTPAFQGTSFADLIDFARRNPGKLRWATTGEGTTGHAVLERVCQAANVQITHVPYKGGGQQLTDALGGHFEVLSTNVAPSQLTSLRAGRFKALAVGSPQRLPVIAEVPTLADLGYPAANLDSLFGLFAPNGTPADVLERINRSIQQALQSPLIRSPLLQANNQPFEGSAQDFAHQVEREILR